MNSGPSLVHHHASKEQQVNDHTPTPDRTLTARKIGVLVHPCPTRQHAEHPGWTCKEVEDAIEASDRFFKQAIARMTTLTDMAELPAALRGPTWKADNR